MYGCSVRDKCGLRTRVTVSGTNMAVSGTSVTLMQPRVALVKLLIPRMHPWMGTEQRMMIVRPTPIPLHCPPSPFPWAESLNLHSWLVRAAIDILGLGFLIYKMGSPILPTSLGGMRIG